MIKIKLENQNKQTYNYKDQVQKNENFVMIFSMIY